MARERNLDDPLLEPDDQLLGRRPEVDDHAVVLRNDVQRRSGQRLELVDLNRGSGVGGDAHCPSLPDPGHAPGMTGISRSRLYHVAARLVALLL